MAKKVKAKKAVKKKPRRIVLGVGHPFFERVKGRTATVTLMTGDCRGDAIPFNFGNLGGYNKIRLVAEVIS